MGSFETSLRPVARPDDLQAHGAPETSLRPKARNINQSDQCHADQKQSLTRPLNEEFSSYPKQIQEKRGIIERSKVNGFIWKYAHEKSGYNSEESNENANLATEIQEIIFEGLLNNIDNVSEWDFSTLEAFNNGKDLSDEGWLETIVQEAKKDPSLLETIKQYKILRDDYDNAQDTIEKNATEGLTKCLDDIHE